jgi:hypothetical protein
VALPIANAGRPVLSYVSAGGFLFRSSVSSAGPAGGVSRSGLGAPGSRVLLAGGAAFARAEPELLGVRSGSGGGGGATVAGSPGGWARGSSAVAVWSDVWTRRRSMAHRPALSFAITSSGLLDDDTRSRDGFGERCGRA